MSHKHQHQRKRSLLIAFWLNLAFSLVEMVGAYYTNSTAILTDAIHDLGDSLAIGLGIVFEKVANRKPDTRYMYGYKRFSLLSAIILSLFLLVGAGVMINTAIGDFLEPHPVNSAGMFGLAVLGLLVNGFAFLRIQQSAQKGKHNHNSKAIMLHFLEDVLGWLAVLVGSAIMYYTHWYWVDGLLSIGIALFIGYNACTNGWKSMRIFLQAAPQQIAVAAFRDALLQIDQVVGIIELRFWSLDEESIVATITVSVNRTNMEDVQEIQHLIHELCDRYGIQHHTVEVSLH
jgi:cobalt-zinc-cadmium efflux system protein